MLQPLPSGPKKGQATDRAKFEESRQKYYKAIGWDERGIPKSDMLAQLGLEDVDRALAKDKIVPFPSHLVRLETRIQPRTAEEPLVEHGYSNCSVASINKL